MSKLSQILVTEAAYLTLHYRMACAGNNIVTTFGGNPATLQLGSGQLAAFLEARLIGLPEGAHQTFQLSPEEAFGPRQPELVKRVSHEGLRQNSAGAEDYQVGDMLEFVAPGGTQFAGAIREVGPEDAVIDLNHPLAGQQVEFEVQIISVL